MLILNQPCLPVAPFRHLRLLSGRRPAPFKSAREVLLPAPGRLLQVGGTRTKTRTPISGLEDRCTVRLCYASILVVPAGIEPAKPASLAPYICQFCYGTMLVSCVGFEPTNSVAGDHCISNWYPRPDSNRELYGSEPFACTFPPRG